MVAVGYFNGTTRTGLLVWVEQDGQTQALGGFAPEELGFVAGPKATTVITTDTEERVLEGWVHPDQIVPELQPA